MKKTEKKLSYIIAEYLTLQYPTMIYRFDVAADIRLTIGQAKIIKDKLRHKRGFPDLMIFYPTEKYHGLFIELKKDFNEIYKKDGTLRQNKHIIEQKMMIDKLNELGYYATFGCGFNDTKTIIDNYVRDKL